MATQPRPQLRIEPPLLGALGFRQLADGKYQLHLLNALDAREPGVHLCRDEDPKVANFKCYVFSSYHAAVKTVDREHWHVIDAKSASWRPKRNDGGGNVALFLDTASLEVLTLAPLEWQVMWSASEQRVASIVCIHKAESAEHDASLPRRLVEANWLAAMQRQEQLKIMEGVFSRLDELKSLVSVSRPPGISDEDYERLVAKLGLK